MAASDSNSCCGIGFLTVVLDAGQGWIGGYLVVNAAARPLEFHCTAPVKPNRAQEILYGPTLGCYLMGEQIAAALVKKSSSPPLVVITDIEPVLAVRSQIEMPVVLLLDAMAKQDRSSDSAEDSSRFRIDNAHDAVPSPHSSLIKFDLARRRVAVSDEYAGDRQRLLAQWPSIAQNFDLAEPLDRIREAIAETQLRGR